MNYKKSTMPLKHRRQTSDRIYGLVEKYFTDLDSIVLSNGTKLSDMSFEDFFTFVRRIPYKIDNAPIEIIARPRYIIEKLAQRGIDCKKKAVLIGSWLRYHNKPYRFLGSSTRPNRNIHHIFPQTIMGSNWVNVDATYPEYRIGRPKTVTAKEVL